jgi:predicted RNA-binding Zn-ribbon protein involved in translation (DUF1610 family)
MSVGYGIDLDLYVALKALEEEELPCEDPDHDTDPEGHSGPGEWYVKVHCPSCGYTHPSLFLICDKLKTRMVSDTFNCPKAGCRAEAKGVQFFTVMGRR